MKKWCFALSLVGIFNLSAQAQEYKYHPIFIYNFSKYIEWPSPQANEDFVIWVVGSEPAYEQMRNISEKKKTIKNQRLVVKNCSSLDEVQQGNIVFITKGARVTSEQMKNELGKKGILVITERDGMAQKGSHINFITTNASKIGFELNTTSTQNAGLKVASALTALAAKTY
ncbi:MAG: YfiR family protein [Tunicatimonas sp.]